jgi:hypothetical protein
MSAASDLLINFRDILYRVPAIATDRPRALVRLPNGTYLKGSSAPHEPQEVPPWRAWLRRQIRGDQVVRAERLTLVEYTTLPDGAQRQVYVLFDPHISGFELLIDLTQEARLKVWDPSARWNLIHTFNQIEKRETIDSERTGETRFRGQLTDRPAQITFIYQDRLLRSIVVESRRD